MFIFPPKVFLLPFNILLIFPLLCKIIRENSPSSPESWDFSESPEWQCGRHFQCPLQEKKGGGASGWERVDHSHKIFLEPPPFQGENLTLCQEGAWNYLHLLPLYIFCQNNGKLRASLMGGWHSVLHGLLLAREGNEEIIFRVPIDLELH